MWVGGLPFHIGGAFGRVSWERESMPSLTKAFCVSFHRVKPKVQLVGCGAMGCALRDEVDDIEIGVGETVPTCPRALRELRGRTG